ncbi:efflux RND transporter periplasmic adaptor subunit [Leptospira bourretii]|uniref:Efflux RND transporter periplasmic adaptor subunit n=1 Tax=Leptospira bourretii TaxID=2484962 RepID=A0A4R9IHS3_9LEPT|nr:efflux RND transporter periplasmic adaptor subunit [Leptospira bourretii]TGK87202.1 efflux RND transporter periplasmic adaptor subunit [Leptospira bourretii]TGK87664.1 efflux RND transporter periplasmic adaptor subunit [Leptospira bourretii]TGL43922.1 efflux RND transporter periplasmic adaptor subunit [Leptospira bourretii]
MKSVYDFLKGIPFFSKFVISGLIYLLIMLAYSNLTWQDFRARIPAVSKLLYSKKLSVSYQIERIKNMNNNETEELSEKDGAIFISVLSLKESEYFPKIQNTAILEPIRTTDIYSKVSGRIEKIFVQEGDKVKNNSKLLKLDSLTYELDLIKQRAAVETAKAQHRLTKEKLANAERAVEAKWFEIEKRKLSVQKSKSELVRIQEIYNKKKELFENNVISQEELENINLELQNRTVARETAERDLDAISLGMRDEDIVNDGHIIPAKFSEKLKLLKKINTKIERSEIEVAEKNIEVAEANIKASEMLIKEATVSSPIEGLVSRINRSEGELINAGGGMTNPIMTIIDVRKLLVTLAVNEKDIGKYRVGQDNYITIDSMPDKKYNGKIKRINPAIDSKTHTSEIKIELNNLDNILRPGMFVRSETIVGEVKKGIQIPLNSLIPKDEKTGYVFIVKDSKAFRVEVELDEKLEDMAIVKKGLKEGDLIITSNLNKLFDGAQVSFSPI